MLKGVDWGPSEFPKPHGQGGMPPYNPHTGVFLIALSWGYGGVDYLYPELSPARNLEHINIKLFL